MAMVMRLSYILDVRVDENIGLLLLNYAKASTEKWNLRHSLFGGNILKVAFSSAFDDLMM
jgi:hypothetical protein